MKIALVIEHFDATRGGAEHVAVWLSQELASRGHEVHVVCHDVAARINRFRQATLRASHDKLTSHQAHPQEHPLESHPGLHIHRLQGVRTHTSFGLRVFGARVRHWIRRHKPDVIHSFSIACPGDIYHPYHGVYAAMQKHAETTRTKGAAASLKRVLQRVAGKQRTFLTLEKRALVGTPLARGMVAKRILSSCEMTTRQFAQEYPAAAAKLRTLNTPRMDFATTRPATPQERAQLRLWLRGHYGISESDRVALFVGHDFRRKGLRYAIEAIARAPSWKLLIVGLGKTREYVELAESLGIGAQQNGGHKARVLFVGPTREMSAVYAAGDALLMPAFYEPSNLVLLEALSHGLPVISTEFLGASELVREHNAGTIVGSPKDVAALASALEALPAPETPAREALIERARHAGKGVSPEAYIKALLELYEQVRSG